MQVWGASPRCLGGYTGHVSDEALLRTPLDKLLPLLHPTLPDASKHPAFVMIATKPEETLAILAGSPRLLSQPHAPPLLLHCDYDSQAGTLRTSAFSSAGCRVSYASQCLRSQVSWNRSPSRS